MAGLGTGLSEMQQDAVFGMDLLPPEGLHGRHCGCRENVTFPSSDQPGGSGICPFWIRTH